MSKKIRVAIVDDHPVVRAGLKSLLSIDPEISVSFEAKNGVDAINKLKTHETDVVLLDLEMPNMNGEETFDQMRNEFPDVKAMIITTYFNKTSVLKFVKKEVPAIISKTTPLDEMLLAIRKVLSGEYYHNEEVSKIMANALASEGKETGINELPQYDLNMKELQVIRLVCMGYTSQQIASKLKCEKRTIESNRNSIWRKTGIQSKAISDLTMFALKYGIISIM